jgi:membrane dipeptidase
MHRPATTLVAVICASAVAAQTPEAAVSEKARRLHQASVVVDTHLDVPYALTEKWADFRVRGATDHVDVPRLVEGGVGAGFFALYVPSLTMKTGGAARLTLELNDVVDRLVADAPELVPAASVADIRGARAAGKIAVLKGIEGGHAIENSLGVLRTYHALGVRYMTLTHTESHDWADATGPFWDPDFVPEPHVRHRGLAPFGEEVVREMNRLGVAVDVSHASDATIEDALAVSRAPIFASHSSCRALSPIPRNLTDEQIRAIGAKGGVVMINFSSVFLDESVWRAYDSYRRQVRPEWEAARARFPNDPAKAKAAGDAVMDRFARVRTPLAKVADHVVHALRLAPGGVGLGSDFDGVSDPPQGLEDVSRLPGLTEELLRRGLTDDQVKGVLGENFLRFLGRVEATAQELAAEPPRTATLR